MSPEILHREAKILIVDDDDAALRLMQAVLQVDGYENLHCINDATQVLTSIIEFTPDLIIMDLMMPGIDGFQLIELIHNAATKILPLPILVVSALGQSDVRYRALSKGAIDVFPKPFEARELVLRVTNLLRLHLSYRQLQEDREHLVQEIQQQLHEVDDYRLELKQAHLEVIRRLACAGEHRDDNTGAHTQRVALTCALIAATMGASDTQVEHLLHAAPLHDVGKIGVPDSILLKPDRLTDSEFKIMQSHCVIGSQILSGGRSEIVQSAERMALGHHEKWDGTGYPYGLKGEEICLECRSLAVADVFDALTHERPYKPALSIEESVIQIQLMSGTHFDPAVVDAFMNLPHAELV